MKTLLDLPFPDMVQQLAASSPIGSRLMSAVDKLGAHPLMFPCQVAAALRDAGFADDRSIKVLVVGGLSLFALDEWRWLTFASVIAGRRHRVQGSVYVLRGLEIGSRFNTPLLDGMPTVRERHGDLDGLRQSLERAPPDVVLVAADVLVHQMRDLPFDISELHTLLRGRAPIYAVTTTNPRGVVLEKVLCLRGVPARPISVPCLDGCDSMFDVIDQPLCRIDLDRAVCSSNADSLLAERLLLRDGEFGQPREGDFPRVKRGPDGSIVVVGIAGGGGIDVVEGRFLIGESNNKSIPAATLPADLFARFRALSDAKQLPGRDFYAWWVDAFIAFNQWIEGMSRNFEAAEQSIEGALSTFGLTLPTVKASALDSPLYKAIAANDRRRVLGFLRGGASMNQARAVDGRIPLAFAACMNVKVVDLIMDHTGDIDHVDSSGWTALAYTVAHGEEELTEDLIDQGANLDFVLPGGTTIRQLQAAIAPILKAREFELLDNSQATIEAPVEDARTPVDFSSGAPSLVGNHPLSAAIAATVSSTPAALDLLSSSDLIKQLSALSPSAEPPSAPSDVLPEPGNQPLASPASDQDSVLSFAPAERGVVQQAPPASLEQKAAPVEPTARITVLVAQGQLVDPLGAPAAHVMAIARKEVSEWLEHGRTRLTVDADDLVWDATREDSRVLAEGNERLWAMRLDHTARNGVVWRAEVVLADVRGDLHAGVRLTRIGVDPADPDPVSIPAVIGSLARRLVWRADALAMVPEARVVREHRAVEGLAALIRNPSRTQPVVTIGVTHLAWIDHDVLAARLMGVAHVVVVDRARAVWLSTTLGDFGSNPIESIRVYRPGYTPDDETRHNPVFPRGVTQPRLLQERVIRAVVRATRWRSSDDDIPTFSAVRLLLAEARSTDHDVATAPAATPAHAVEHEPDPMIAKPEIDVGGAEQLAGGSIVDRTQLENASRDLAEMALTMASLRDALNRAKEVLDEERATTREELERLRMEIQGLREEESRLRQHNRSLRSTIDELQSYRVASSGADASAVEFPDNFDVLPDWAARYLGDDVILLPRAVKAAKDSPLADPRKAYEALWLLKEYYVPTLYGDRDAASDLEMQCTARGLEVCKVGTAATSHRYKAQYEITWRGQHYTMDRHVSGNSSRDPRLTLRVYFAVDENTATVIVGFLPGHLDNRMS